MKESKMPEQPALTSPFMLAKGTTVMRAEGDLTPVSEADALKLAQQRGSVVVGLIPFAPGARAQLAVPEGWVAEENPLPSVGRVEQPAPSLVEGQDNEVYREAVARAIELMNRGRLDKVVLARLLKVRYEEEVNLPHLFDTLRSQQPRATVFSAQLPSGNYLMGASPELVLQTEGSSFRTLPLAGSAARTAPSGSTEDAHIGEALMRSAKDRTEHATVIKDIRQRLAALTQQIDVPAVPSLLATPQLWHLSTPVTGQLLPGITSLEAARAIHPTPAICGTPTGLARQLIEELEPFERGFFGGLVGHMDASGQGSWYLVLRCAELAPQQATLFAGAGIVRDSVPASEHAETATKLGTFARALGLELDSL